MVDITDKLNQIMKMVEEGNYFTINKPRQYGKTTTMYLLKQKLKQSNEYLAIKTSFEGIGDASFETENNFTETFLSLLVKEMKFHDVELAKLIKSSEIQKMNELGDVITEIVITSQKKIVLIIDEVDKSSNNQLFLSFIGMLRQKYLLTREGEDQTFHSVILGGVHDVKSLKLKLRPGEEEKYNSPWNIAVDFKVDLSFNPKEIETMLRQYVEEKSAKMNIELIAKKLYYYTSGYPFLVSKLCQIIDEELQKTDWKVKDLEIAVDLLLKQENTNFDSLIKNLENNPDLYKLVEKLTLQSTKVDYNYDNPLINLGILYGIFKEKNDKVAIHNRIYSERIYNYMSVNLMIENLSNKRIDNYNFRDNFIKSDKSLDMEMVLLKFQEFMKKEYSSKDAKFIERNGRLIFLAFLKPIINGQGYDFKEAQVSEEKRLDVIVTYLDQKYVIELKIWRGSEYHSRGLKQLSDYLDCLNLSSGYLVAFDFSKEKKFTKETLQFDNKQVLFVKV